MHWRYHGKHGQLLKGVGTWGIKVLIRLVYVSKDKSQILIKGMHM